MRGADRPRGRGHNPHHEYIELLARVDLFAQLDDITLAKLAACVEPVAMKDGFAVCRQGDPADCLYIVTQGTFGVFVSSPTATGETRLGTIRLGEHFGEMALLTDEPRSATVRAEGDGQILRLGRKHFLDLLEQQPTVALPIIATLCRRLRAADQAAAKSYWAVGCTIDRALEQLMPEQRQIVFRELDDEGGIAMALNILAEIANYGGEYTLARSLAEESLVIRQVLGNRWAIGSTLNNMAVASLNLGDCASAWSLYRESLVIWRKLGDRWRIAQALDGFAGVAACQSQPDRAIRLAGAAAALRESIRAPLPRPLRTVLERWLEPARQTLSEEAYATAWVEGRAMGLEQAIAYALASPAGQNADITAEKPAIAAQRYVLTSREREVAILVARGWTNRQIAEELVISERTVEAHVANIFNKLGLASRIQIAAWALEHGLIGVKDGEGWTANKPSL